MMYYKDLHEVALRRGLIQWIQSGIMECCRLEGDMIHQLKSGQFIGTVTVTRLADFMDGNPKAHRIYPNKNDLFLCKEIPWSTHVSLGMLQEQSSRR